MNKKTQIFYFSGTGNSKQVAKWFSEFAIKRKMICKMNDIAKTEISELGPINPDELIIFISPVHGFNFPKITLNFILNFPIGKNRVVLMNTRAGMKICRFVTPGLTGIAFILSSFLLKRKGYKIVGQIPFDMPSNWISIHPALRENAVRYIYKKNYYRVEKHADKIFSGKKDFIALRDIIQDIIIAPVSLGYFILARYAFAKSFYASYKCDNCGNCIKQCPVKAIETINNHPFWTFKCESCMKCMNSCPKRAIETAHGLFVIVALVVPIISSFLIITMLPLEDSNNIPGFILQNLTFIFILWLLYKFQHQLLENKIIGKIILFTSLTYFKFWGRYKSIPDYKWKNTN